jgi:SEC-C motif
MTATGSWTYGPVLTLEGEGRINPPAAFDQWWRQPFLRDTNDRPITRRSVVLDVANKDGGAHVTRAIPEAFRLLASGESLPFQVGSDDGSSSGMPGIVMATMRQVAFELLDTLHRDLPNFILGGPLAVSAQLTVAERSGILRNDPCPCESGKKFKTCHAHSIWAADDSRCPNRAESCLTQPNLAARRGGLLALDNAYGCEADRLPCRRSWVIARSLQTQ